VTTSGTTGFATGSISEGGTGFNASGVGSVYGLVVNRSATNKFGLISYRTATAEKWAVGMRETGDNYFRFYSSGSFSNDVLTLRDDTGAATFAGAVTANGQLIGKGTATNDNAATGYIGEYVSSTVVFGSAVSLTSTTAANVTSISLTAGDWDVTGLVIYAPAGSTSITQFTQSISQTSATLVSLSTATGATTQLTSAASVPGADISQVIPYLRVSLSGTTTVYLVAKSVFSVSTMSAYGTISARRVR